MERQQKKGKEAFLVLPLGPRHFLVGLFRFTLSKTCISTLRAGRGLKALTPWSFQLSGVLAEHRELIQTCSLYKWYDANVFFMKMRELPHALNFIEFYRHG